MGREACSLVFGEKGRFFLWASYLLWWLLLLQPLWLWIKIHEIISLFFFNFQKKKKISPLRIELNKISLFIHWRIKTQKQTAITTVWISFENKKAETTHKSLDKTSFLLFSKTIFISSEEEEKIKEAVKNSYFQHQINSISWLKKSEIKFSS